MTPRSDACRLSWWAGALVFALQGACASLRFGGAAVLRIDCNVPEAAIFIDDVYEGPCASWSVDGRLVSPGFRRVEVRHPERYTHYQELELVKGDAVRMDVQLRPWLELSLRPDGPRSQR
ncbi:MAG: hypothetical protein KA712_05465 [Myxococcales bacterium]|nr:hypothetical protein [Myxococcales bacterium]